MPLATRGAVRGLLPREVAELGFEMVLGNTFHLMLEPGPDTIAAHGGLDGFMGWQGPIITDSGGFQVFSMGHGTVADEIKGRRPGRRSGSILAIEEEGVRFRSYLDGSEHFLSPERSMQVQAALGSDIALAFDECTPFHVTREYTARSTERTHRWLERCLAWHVRARSAGQVVYGIVQGGVHEDLRRDSAREVAGQRLRGDRDRRLAGPRQGADARGRGLGHRGVGASRAGSPASPAGDRRRRRPDRAASSWASTRSTARCPPAWRATGWRWCPRPRRRWRIDLAKAPARDQRGPVLDGCRCEACAGGHSARLPEAT